MGFLLLVNCLLEEVLKHVLLAQLFKQLEDQGHVVVAPSFVFDLPVILPDLLFRNISSLQLQAGGDLT